MRFVLDTLRAPPPEDEIISRWLPEKGRLVSICMLAYNHEPYLRDAINSVLNQETDFGFEILIHDDASQDKSADIIREYEKSHPRIIKPIYQRENQHSQKLYPTIYFNYPRANLPFVAICEGDDYWTSKKKLQKQIDGLLKNPGVNLSFHPATLIYMDQADKDHIFGIYRKEDGIIPFHDINHRIRGWIPTASCVIRQSTKNKLHEFMQARANYLSVGDIYLQLFGAMPEGKNAGGALFFSEPMSVYRYRTEHSWSRRLDSNYKFKAWHEIAMMRSYLEIDDITSRKYHTDFTALVLQRILWLFNRFPPPLEAPSIIYLDKYHSACQAAVQETIDRYQSKEERYVIFGSASACERLINNIDSKKISAIIDRDDIKTGEILYGKPVISLKGLTNYSDHSVIISTISPSQETIEKIKSYGIPHHRIHLLFKRALDYLEENPIDITLLTQENLEI